jgi:cell division inhibitor SepF
MPGAMHRMGVYLGLVEDDDYADGGDGYGPERTSDRVPARRDDYAPHAGDGYSRETQHGRSATALSHAYDDDPYAGAAESTYQITSLHPRTYNEARAIGEHFRASTPVIMNLSEMNDPDAKRLVDFAAGLTFGLHGRIERVTAKVFLLTPHNVTVTAQDKARIESGFFNQS